MFKGWEDSSGQHYESYDATLDEMVEFTIELVWNDTIFCAPFKKHVRPSEARETHSAESTVKLGEAH